MKFPLSPSFRVLAAGLVLSALSGCASAPSSQEAGARVSPARAAAGQESQTAQLRKGMTQEQVRQALGAPAEVRPVDTPEGKAETWIYRRRVSQKVDQQATGTQEVPYVDPITGQMRMIPEPTYSLVTTSVTEQLHLFWFNGELASWNTQYLTDRSYDR